MQHPMQSSLQRTELHAQAYERNIGTPPIPTISDTMNRISPTLALTDRVQLSGSSTGLITSVFGMRLDSSSPALDDAMSNTHLLTRCDRDVLSTGVSTDEGGVLTRKTKNKGAFWLGKQKLFVFRASLFAWNHGRLARFAFVLHVPTQKTCKNHETLHYSSRKVPPKKNWNPPCKYRGT